MQTAKRPFDVVYKRVICNNFTFPVENFDCNIRKVDINQYASSFSITLNRQLNNNSEIRIQIFYRLSSKDSKTIKFMDIKMKICDALDQINSVPLIKRLFNELMRSSNVPYSCPIHGVSNNRWDRCNFFQSWILSMKFPEYQHDRFYSHRGTFAEIYTHN